MLALRDTSEVYNMTEQHTKAINMIRKIQLRFRIFWQQRNARDQAYQEILTYQISQLQEIEKHKNKKRSKKQGETEATT